MFSDNQVTQNSMDQKNTDNEEIVLPLETEDGIVTLPKPVSINKENWLIRQYRLFNVKLNQSVVVGYIMEFLPYLDRVAARQVCHLWYEASIKRRLLDKEKVVFKRMVLDDDSTAALNVIDRSARPFYHFAFIELELSTKMKRFWANVGPDMTSLSIQNCDLTERMLVEILSQCTQLEELEINNCREPLISGRLLDTDQDVQLLKRALHNVTRLSLCYNRYLSDALFNRFVAIVENVDSLCLAGCQISFHPGLYKKFYPSKLLSVASSYASETVLTFLNVMNFIEGHGDRLRSLDLSQTLINSRCLSQIAELATVSLRELHLQNCEQLTNSGVLAVTEHQRGLVTLDLSGCLRVTDQALISICQRLHQLQRLRLCNCRAITDLGVTHLKHLRQLRAVDLSHCEQVTGAAIETAFEPTTTGVTGAAIETAFQRTTTGNRMRQLCVRALKQVTHTSMMRVIENLTGITRLDVSYCFTAITDQSLQCIFKHLTLLRSLKMANCDAVTDVGFIAIDWPPQPPAPPPRYCISLASKAEQEVVRDAANRKLICDLDRERDRIQRGTHSLASLTGLQELDVQSCNGITDLSLEFAFTLNELQYLNLSRCQQITDVGLAMVAVNNPSIDTINVSGCDNISDEGVKALVTSLHRLRHIDLQGCKHLTDASLLAIERHCGGLRHLDITNCKMNVDTVDLSSMAALHTFHSSTTFY